MKVGDEHPKDGHYVAEILLKVVMALEIFIKLTNYLRFWERFGFLNKMVILTF